MKVYLKNVNNADKIIPDHVMNLTLENLKQITKLPIGRAYTHKILNALQNIGWSGTIKISSSTNLKIHGVMENIGLVVHFGNHYNSYYYLLNLEHMFIMNKIKAGIVIIQTRNQAIKRHGNKKQPNNTGNYIEYDKFNDEFELYKAIFNIPLTIIAIEEESP